MATEPENYLNSTAVPPGGDTELLAALRNGDETAFLQLVQRHQGALLKVARLYVADGETAQEVVQETWLAVLQGLERFEGRSSLKTWIFRILVNRAKTRGQREGRSIPFSDVWSLEDEPDEPAVDPSRFRPPDAAVYPNGWLAFPRPWDDVPETRLLSQETRRVVEDALARLPPSQRAVMTLRDVDGLSSQEVCNVLGISESNQRVLLHRARSRVRQALEVYLKPEGKNVGDNRAA